MKKKLGIIIACLCVAVFIASGAALYLRRQENIRAAEAAMAAETARIAAREAAAQASARLKAVTVKGRQPAHEFTRPAPPPLVPRANILDLLELNPDTVGYLSIENSKIDYPVVQGTDNDYYLHHTFDYIYATRGSIFVDCNVELDPEILPPHILMHGHHMRDGSMFKDVANYKTKSFFEDHPLVRYETLYLDTVWQVFSVYVCDSNEYVPMSFKDDETFVEYAEKVAARSMYHVDMPPFTAEDRLLTLNTCSYEFGGAHTLVVAKLIRVGYDIDWMREAG